MLLAEFQKDARQFLTLPLLMPFISLPVFWYLVSQHDINLSMLLLIIPNIGVAIWYALAIIYFAAYGRKTLVLSPEEEFAVKHRENILSM